MTIRTIIPIIQIIVSVLLVGLILLQERSAGLGGLFGGETGVYQVRRGFEKIIFWATIVLAVLFLVLAVVQLLY